MKWSIAFRNFLRHKLRSTLSVLMVSGSIASIIIFIGYTENSKIALKKFAGDLQFGHVQLATENYWENKNVKMDQKLVGNSAEIFTKLKGNPLVKSFSGRLSSFGLLSTGSDTTSVKFQSIDPKNEQESLATLTYDQGGPFNSEGNEVLLGMGIAKKLAVKAGDEITAVVQTIDGTVNAMDLKVTGIASSGVAEIDNYISFLSLDTMQRLMDTTKVEQIVIRGYDIDKHVELKDSIDKQIAELNFSEIKSRSWRSLATLYNQVEEFYNIQNFLINSILISLMLLGILNTVGMSIHERTGEIGTIRALGNNRWDVVELFVYESLITSFIGIILGYFFSILVIEFFNHAHITTLMPGTSKPLKVQLSYVMWAFVSSALVATCTAFFATVIPAIKASTISIVEALRKNI